MKKENKSKRIRVEKYHKASKKIKITVYPPEDEDEEIDTSAKTSKAKYALNENNFIICNLGGET